MGLLNFLNTSASYNNCKKQRDVARVERDKARNERDASSGECDKLRDDMLSLKKDQLSQEQFVVTLSHDLRNPVGAIKMAIEILRSSESDKHDQIMMDIINRNADSAEDLIVHLLDTNLIKSGSKFPIEKKWCEVLSIVQKSRGFLAPTNQERIVLEKIENGSIWGFWDSYSLERVFNNLFSNALKFSDVGTEIKVRVWQDPDITGISIQNFGNVISLEDQQKIFNGQYRSPSCKTQRLKGWGLGLTLVKGIAEAHGGKVDVTSSKQEGTVFTVRLPNSLYN